MIDTYIFRLKYFNEFEDEEDIEAFGTIGAESYEEAVSRITKRFPNIINLSIKELFACDGFTFLGEEEYEKLLREDEES